MWDLKSNYENPFHSIYTENHQANANTTLDQNNRFQRMGEMKKERQSRTEEKSYKEVETTAMVAVGVVLLIAGVKQGLTTLVGQWRALVFLFLNLLLLTIFFTSTIHFNKPTKTKSNKEEGGEINAVKKNKKMKKSCTSSSSTSWPVQVDELFKIEESVVMLTPHDHEKVDSVVVVDEDVDIVVDEMPLVSKEELNQRVESFIMMFRQQLALDAMGRSTTTATTRHGHHYLSSNIASK